MIQYFSYTQATPTFFIVTIHGIQVQNALVDLGASIDFMKKEALSRLHIIGLREKPTILQLVDSSPIKPDGMIEDAIVTLNSWEYPVDFFILSPKDIVWDDIL